jgi:hypothetical protein
MQNSQVGRERDAQEESGTPRVCFVPPTFVHPTKGSVYA